MCTAQTADVFVQVTERVGSAIAQGFGFTSVSCDGSMQKITVVVTANSEKAFKRGHALAQSQISGCLKICGSESDSRDILIAKAKH